MGERAAAFSPDGAVRLCGDLLWNLLLHEITYANESRAQSGPNVA